MLIGPNDGIPTFSKTGAPRLFTPLIGGYNTLGPAGEVLYFNRDLDQDLLNSESG